MWEEKYIAAMSSSLLSMLSVPGEIYTGSDGELYLTLIVTKLSEHLV